MEIKMRIRNRTIKWGIVPALILTVCLLTACSGGGQDPGSGTPGGTNSNQNDTQSLAIETANALMAENENPQIASVGGDWLIKGLYHSGAEVPESYYNHYYDNVRAAVKSQKGILSEDHYTEYERLIICLATIGKDFTDIEGYDMRPFLDDYYKIEQQGSNAASYALVASNVGGFPLENEERYIDLILKETGETNAMGAQGLSDYTAMAAEALSFYKGRENVDAFLEEAVTFLSEAQNENGALNNCEATAECIMALTQLGINPLEDERFVKNGNTLEDGLLTFYLGNGSFFHDEELKEADPLSTEKALLALDALLLNKNGLKLYEKE